MKQTMQTARGANQYLMKTLHSTFHKVFYLELKIEGISIERYIIDIRRLFYEIVMNILSQALSTIEFFLQKVFSLCLSSFSFQKSNKIDSPVFQILLLSSATPSRELRHLIPLTHLMKCP